MNPSLKKLCIFSLAASIGGMLVDQAAKDSIKWRAEKLREAGQAAIDHAHIKIDTNAMKRVEKKIDQVCKNKEYYDVAEMLSFLILGIQDLNHYCKFLESLITLEARALWFLKIFDPKLDQEDVHTEALRRYEEWIS